ncbi:MAG TPA: hypothetical protein VJN21_12000 [Candidatus Acidoferrales bacterium]|nr:hypothetical protein [Candidatus Acidoferrales bacterium]
MAKPRFIICPNSNCGYNGPARTEPRGSCLIAGLLFLLGILPGVLYIVFRRGYRYYCLKCGLQIAADN